jgi:hypothetical protein
MKKLREIHLYLGCLFAPMLIFFAVTGAWQLFGLHHGRKDGSFRPPAAFVLLSAVHRFQHFTSDGPTPLRYFMLAASVGLVVTSVLGIVMAFRYGRSKRQLSQAQWLAL